MRRHGCLITDSDRCRLGTLLSSGENRAWGKATCLRTLDARLEDAKAVTRQQTPSCLVTMIGLPHYTRTMEDLLFDYCWSIKSKSELSSIG